MKLYQPFLFVGLGGTGCAIGAELERRLREEICGPDGTAFMRRREDALRYQLPDCVQFVYADVNQGELDRLPLKVVPGPQHVPAAEATAHYARSLVPRADSYPEVAISLRMSAERLVADWLPPERGEPRVTPLQRGAGQLPTIGRAALFETLRGGIKPATIELRKALDKLAGGQVKTDLFHLSGRTPSLPAVDVFVAFSVAGGTGAGIFWDYLHLIGERFSHSGLKPRIYPLVLMPSAFDEGVGGGRPARLNAGRSVLDLFRLVDQQNADPGTRTLRGHESQTPIDSGEVAVHYPVEGRVKLGPGTVQTAFLFSRPMGAEPRDLRRSVVSLVLSLIGTEFEQGRDPDGEQYQSFADSFINGTVDRQVQAENGIGNRGVSTALVTSLTVPVDKLADVVAGRLLRAGVTGLAEPLPATERNTPYIKEFMVTAGIGEILERRPADHAEPEPALGRRAVENALADRVEAMREGLGRLRRDLDDKVPELVAGFDPPAAARHLLGRFDPFRLRRVLTGDERFAAEADRLGVIGIMHRRRTAPTAPKGLRDAPPGVPEMRDRRLGTVRVRWSDPEVEDARAEQDAWYQWRTQVLWTEPWNTLAARWKQHAERAETPLVALNEALEEEARRDLDDFPEQEAKLYQPRVGVSYLLPPGGNLERFYDRVLAFVKKELVAEGVLQAAATESEVLQELVGPEAWRQAYTLACENNVALAVSQLRERVKGRIKIYLRQGGSGRSPILPTLQELLAEAAKPTGRFQEEELRDFRSKLVGLVPADFTPQGSGQLKVLVSYAAPEENPAIQEYLRKVVTLPSGRDIHYEFKPTSTETVTVVLFRTAMGVTDVREVREVLRTWADASESPEPQDYLMWRQRTGYRSGYLATHEEHRTVILHHLLCAMWNGKVATVGEPDSPESITITLAGGVTMTLDLTPLVYASSWASLLRAYEKWTFADDEGIRREFCARLMREVPDGISGNPRPPSELYGRLADLADKEIAYIDEKLAGLHSSALARARQMRDFWAVTLPAARRLEFEGPQIAFANLAALEELYLDGGR
ncbi:hypothetical protein GCM10010191_53070 [Actinomadura vinacea]|uniref:Tubulin-like doman-containing protein n=1 Tax=Actinomadura vinacea TaxID=115336 RepID=A0ABN3JMC1_9ACTN